MDKKDIFKKELSYLKNNDYKTDAIKLIESLPDYFFVVEASSTRKYHPRYALGEGGLVRHTKAAVRIAYELLQDPVIGNKYSDREKDLMLIALLVHDGLKLGVEKERYTRFDHPLLIGKHIKAQASNLVMTSEDVDFLVSVTSTHMGPWTKDYNGNEVLPYPKTKYQNFVHMCDYLASRKCLILEFDANNDILE